MEFHLRRRQQFLSEQYFSAFSKALQETVELWKTTLPAHESELSGRAFAFGRVAEKTADLFLLRYTAGEPLEALRADLTEVIESYEVATAHALAYEQDDEASPLNLAYIEEYQRLLQLVCLCFLFHRVDLLSRVVALFDGGTAGEDSLYEGILSYEMDDRYDVDELLHGKPYKYLSQSLNRESDHDSIQDVSGFLKAWYLAMRDARWHDSHLNLTESGPGYFGYWAIEAGAVAYLLELDDSMFRNHLVYPKDLVDFARALDDQLSSRHMVRRSGSGAKSNELWRHIPSASVIKRESARASAGGVASVDFCERRRQHLLSEAYYSAYHDSLVKGIHLFQTSIPANESELSGRALTYGRAAKKYMDLFLLRYTAGKRIEELRQDLSAVVELYEIAAKHLRAYEQDEESSPLLFSYIEEYGRAMQLIGLCFLLHRTELLPRLSALFDGLFAGDDNLYEDLLSCAMDGRYEGDELIHPKPYLHLMNSFNRESDKESIQDIEKYLKSWYLSMKSTTWHDSHLNLTARGPGYYGYWAIEAAAVAYVLELDDSAFRDHLVYPKDLIDFARKMDAAEDSSLEIQQDPSAMRVEGGQSCPQAGFWATPAQQDGRRYFNAGEIMPTFEHSAYGATIWQWSEEQ